MTELVIRRPGLVVAIAHSPFLRLRARRCGCGYIFCPPHSYGCERCGAVASAGEDVELYPRGVLTALTTVHAHPKLATPYGIGRVVLDPGPVLDVRVEGVEQLAIGCRVVGRLFATKDASGAEALDCHFVLEEQAR